MFNTFFQKLFCDNGSNDSHQTHNLMYLHTLLGASLQPQESVCSTSRNNPLEWHVFSPLQCTSATKKGRISNHPARQGEMDNTQSWLFQCQMITNTTTDCLIRHLISEAWENRQHKPKNYRMWFFSTVNSCAFSRTIQSPLTCSVTAVTQESNVFELNAYQDPSVFQPE